jgi:hypothetical protein
MKKEQNLGFTDHMVEKRKIKPFFLFTSIENGDFSNLNFN